VAKGPVVPYVVVGLARSGTTVIGRTLDELPGVVCHGEVLTTTIIDDGFTPKNVYLRSPEFLNAGISRYIHPVQRRIAYVDDLILRHPEEPVCGFKWMYNQLALSRVGNALLYRLPWTARRLCSRAGIDWAVRNDVRVVNVVRENVLELFASMTAASSTGVYHSTEAPASPTRTTLPVRGLAFHLNELERAQQATAALFGGAPVLVVRHEDPWESKFGRISDFLDLGGLAGTAPSLKRLRSGSLRESLENFDEVATALRHTRFSGMLGE
jgi:LPS sulfotransferase NodH